MAVEQNYPQSLTRRNFLIKSTFLATVGYVGLRSNDILEEVSSPLHSDLQILPPQFQAPPSLRGIAVNFPYLTSWLEYPGILGEILRSATEIGAVYIRAFPSKKSETELGRYEYGYLENIAYLSERFPLQVEIIDGYPIFHSEKWSPSYSPTVPESPYLIKENGDLKAQRLAIFHDGRARESLVAREYEVARFFRDVPGVIALSIGNEIEPPTESHEEAQELMAELYPLLVQAAREGASNKPLLSGVADPTLVPDGLGLIDTLHIYPEFFSNKFEGIMARLRSHPRSTPMICQEIGYPSVLKLNDREIPIPFHDRLRAGFIDRTLAKFVEINAQDRWKRLQLDGVVLWRLTFDGNPHKDGFGIIPAHALATMETISSWQRFFKSSPANNAA